jgi:hypothetical protein
MERARKQVPMSALGQKQTLEHVRVMSALPSKADIRTQPRNVRFVPKADIAPVAVAAISGIDSSAAKFVVEADTNDGISHVSAHRERITPQKKRR